MAEQRDRAKADARAKKTGWRPRRSTAQLLERPGRPTSPATTTLHTESRVLGADRRRRRRAEPRRRRRDRRGRPGPHAVLRRVRRPGRRRRPIVRRRRRAEVLDVQRPVKGLVAHQVRVLEGELRPGPSGAEVDREWRLSACQAHSGTHVRARGAAPGARPEGAAVGLYNRPGYLRLDFAWPGALPRQQRPDIEDVANAAVRADLRVHRAVHDAARGPRARRDRAVRRDLRRAVRVVEIGGPGRGSSAAAPTCASAQIGTLALTASPRSAPASPGRGARRPRGLPLPGPGARPGAPARPTAQGPAGRAASSGSAAARPAARRRKELAGLRAEALLAGAGELAAARGDVGGVAVVAAEVSRAGSAAASCARWCSTCAARLVPDRGGVVALASRRFPTARWQLRGGHQRGGPRLRAGVRGRGGAGDGAAPVGGRGGGKDDVAQGGGTDPAGIPAALPGRRAGGCSRHWKVSSVPRETDDHTNGDRTNGEDTGPVGGRRTRAARRFRPPDRAPRPARRRSTTRRRRST